MTPSSPEFWIALMQIIGVNIVLSGDNAVVIALAARSLPRDQQKRAVAWGSGAAVVMRIALTIVAVELLRLPYLKLVGAGLLLWIAVQLLLPEDEDDGPGGGTTTMAAAIKTILIADLVMSLDNVIGVAAAAKGNNLLLIIGLAISIPLVIFASRLLLTLMERFPFIITLGAALLGWVAGEMAITDPISQPWIDANAPLLHWLAPLLGAAIVIALGKLLARRREYGPADAPGADHLAGDGPAADAGPSRFQRMLVAVDGSAGSERAVRRLIDLRQSLRDPTGEVHLLNVQRPLSGDVSRFVAGEALDDYHRERSEQAMAPARAMLAAAGLPYKEHVHLGDPGEQIAQVAHAQNCDLIVMGTRGLGSHAAGIIGSVAQGTLAESNVPVLLVK